MKLDNNTSLKPQTDGTQPQIDIPEGGTIDVLNVRELDATLINTTTVNTRDVNAMNVEGQSIRGTVADVDKLAVQEEISLTADSVDISSYSQLLVLDEDGLVQKTTVDDVKTVLDDSFVTPSELTTALNNFNQKLTLATDANACLSSDNKVQFYSVYGANLPTTSDRFFLTVISNGIKVTQYAQDTFQGDSSSYVSKCNAYVRNGIKKNDNTWDWSDWNKLALGGAKKILPITFSSGWNTETSKKNYYQIIEGVTHIYIGSIYTTQTVTSGTSYTVGTYSSSIIPSDVRIMGYDSSGNVTGVLIFSNGTVTYTAKSSSRYPIYGCCGISA